MLETMNRLMLAGLGAVSMTRERAEKIFEEYVHRGEAERAEREGFIKDLMDSTDRARKELEGIIERQVRATIDRLDLPTRTDLARLEAKIDSLLLKAGL